MSLRSHLPSLVLCVGVSSLLGMACSNNADGAVPVTSGAEAPLTRTALDGTVDQALVTPHGDIRGLLLRDGTVVRLPPGGLAAGAVSPGDAVQIDGDLVTSPAGRSIEHAKVTKSGQVVAQASEPPARKPRDPKADKQLGAMEASGAVKALLTRPDGGLEGVVLADGTTASLPPKASVAALGLKVGDTVKVTGRGGTYQAGKALHVDAITLADGQTRVIDTPPPVMTAVSRQGDIERVLVNPHGDVDTLLLADGATVRVAPTAPSERLAKGQKVQIEGEGAGNFVRATRVVSASGEVLTKEPSEPPAPRAPGATKPVDTMQDLKTTSTIARVVRGPRGEADALVLADGATVKLPPRLRDDAGEALREGARVQVEGRGGTYPQGVSLRATSVQIEGGATFTEPAPPAPPAGGPPGPPGGKRPAPPAGGPPGPGPGRGPGR